MLVNREEVAMSEQALSDVKVLDLTWHIAGPYCTKLLGDYGADVIKVERPGSGDPARSLGPFLGDDPHPEKSGLFAHLNTNKRSITLNLKNAAGKKLFKELLKGVDILVENFSPHVMPSLGLSYEELEKLNPRLVMTSISNFGQTGPYRDYKASEFIIYAMGGAMYHIGLPEREPVKKGGRVIEYQAGVHAAGATMLALLVAESLAAGQHVDISMLNTQMGTIDRRMSQLLAYQYNNEVTPRTDPRLRTRYPFGVHRCKDGFWEVFGYGQLWPRTTKMVGRPELLNDPRWSTLAAQAQPGHFDEWQAFFLPWCLDRTKRECFEVGQAAGILCGPLNTAADLLSDAHYRVRAFWVDIEHPVTGKLTYPGAPIKAEEMPWVVRSPAPLLGQHNEEVYGALGYGKEDLVKLREREVI
jgi:crotonobetainyl-CoA:carnitine CoA-transferase CaiB-like acyl-CoA transferase